MEFHDFQIRGWTVDRQSAAVLVHSSPAGAMERPEIVSVDWGILGAFRKVFQQLTEITPSQLTEGGRGLADVILPAPVVGLLTRSLERINPEDGLRVRLCLDSTLLDLPWEYLVLPNVAEPKLVDGFLSLNARVSLVREPSQPGRHRPTLREKQRLLFFGTRLCLVSGEDAWKIVEEKDRLIKALEPASPLLDTRAVLSDEIDCQTALMREDEVDIFHYSGHTDVEDGKGYLLSHEVQSDVRSANRLEAGALGSLLRRARTTVAVFSACNSGSWAFVEPLLRADVPVVVGAQGVVAVPVAIVFCQRFYSALAIGLSLDEAITWARLHLLEPGVVPKSLTWQWGSFMVYMQTPEAVLFPRPSKPQVAEQQDVARRERQLTIINVTQNIGSIQGGEVTGMSAGSVGIQRDSEKTDGSNG
jgi:hypothetical protein